jgi:hypothetical protein
VLVIEDELNALIASSEAAARAEKKDTAAPEGWLSAGTPNVRIRDGVVQVGMPVTIRVLGLGEKVVMQARGGFVRRGDLFVYEPDELYLGSLPLQRLPFFPGYLRDKVLRAQSIPDDIAASWRNLAAVGIEGAVLQLAMP